MKKPILIAVGGEIPYNKEHEEFFYGITNPPPNPEYIKGLWINAYNLNNPNPMQEIPRRNIVTRHTEAEATIHKAIKDVEYLGASPELTAITMKLTEVFNMLADYVDKALFRIAEKEQEQEDDDRLISDRV
jgi:hypothetical protein